MSVYRTIGPLVFLSVHAFIFSSKGLSNVILTLFIERLKPMHDNSTGSLYIKYIIIQEEPD